MAVIPAFSRADRNVRTREDFTETEKVKTGVLACSCVVLGFAYGYVQYDSNVNVTTMLCIIFAVIFSLLGWCFLVYTAWKFTEVKDVYGPPTAFVADSLLEGLRRQRRHQQRRANPTPRPPTRRPPRHRDTTSTGPTTPAAALQVPPTDLSRIPSTEIRPASRDELARLDLPREATPRPDTPRPGTQYNSLYAAELENDVLNVAVHISDHNSSDEEDIATDQGERDSTVRDEILAALDELDQDALDSHASQTNTNRTETDTDVFDLMDGRVELGPPVTVSNRDGIRLDRARRPHITGLHVEVAIRDHYNVDIRANGDIGQTELDALTDMALIRVLNNWSGNAAIRPNAIHNDDTIFAGLLEAFLLGARETIEIIMAYAMDLPHIGPHILQFYLWFLTHIENFLAVMRNERGAWSNRPTRPQTPDTVMDSTTRDQTTQTASDTSQQPAVRTDVDAAATEPEIEEFVPSDNDILLKIMFMDDTIEELMVHPDSRISTLTHRLPAGRLYNLRYIHNGKILPSTQTFTEAGFCAPASSRVIHCIKSSKGPKKSSAVPATSSSSQSSSATRIQRDMNNNDATTSEPRSSNAQAASSNTSGEEVPVIMETQPVLPGLMLGGGALARFLTSFNDVRQLRIRTRNRAVEFFRGFWWASRNVARMMRNNLHAIGVTCTILWSLNMLYIYAYASSYIILSFDSEMPLSMLLTSVSLLSVAVLHLFVQ